MKGGKAALWKDEDMGDTFLAKAVSFIERHRQEKFFLYYATHEPHVPRVPHPRFVGRTSMGPRGDAIAQMDWSVGQILQTLDRLNLTANTLVVFSSDNGPVLDDGYKDQAREKIGDHQPAGPLRGGKYSAFEAGTRVPFLVRWPARVKPDVSSALISQVDFVASFAALVNAKADFSTAPDSRNHLPALLGQSKTGRTSLVEQAGPLALRDGNWKYITPGKGPKVTQNTGTETGIDPAGQLFDLSKDLGETRNLAAEQPEKAREMSARLEAERPSKPAARPAPQRAP
jgi:arylsulfatase A-like enzyme